MKYRKEKDNYLVCLEIGDDIIESLIKFAKYAGLHGATLQGIGAVDHAEIGYFDIVAKDYLKKEVDEQREMLSLQGNIGVTREGEIIVHAHVILGDGEMNCVGGHLFSGRISVTGEIRVLPANEIVRLPNRETTLKLWNLDI